MAGLGESREGVRRVARGTGGSEGKKGAQGVGWYAEGGKGCGLQRLGRGHGDSGGVKKRVFEK